MKKKIVDDIVERMVSNDPTLTELVFTDKNYNAHVYGIAICNAMKFNTTLTSLNISQHMYGYYVLQSLIESLKTNTTLTSLDISESDLRDEYGGPHALAEALRMNTALTYLNLEHIMINAEGADAIGKALVVNKTLKHLKFGDNPLSYDAITRFASGVAMNKGLDVLDLSQVNFRHQESKPIADIIRINTSLKTLELSNCDMTDKGAIGDALKVNTTLVSLNLSINYPEDDGIKSIADALKVNTTLASLDLSVNFIDDDGAELIANALKVNTTLSFLDLHSNRIKEKGAMAIANALRINRSLTSLHFDNRSMPREGLDAISNAIYESNGMLTFFSPSGGQITKALERNKKAHQRARAAVLQLLTIGKYRNEKDLFTKHDSISELLKKIPKDIYGVLARKLWATRGNPSWWKPEEGPGGTFSQPTAIESKLGNNCIQCNINPAQFMEETQPNHRFCSELCQWMLRVGSRHGISFSK